MANKKIEDARQVVLDAVKDHFFESIESKNFSFFGESNKIEEGLFKTLNIRTEDGEDFSFYHFYGTEPTVSHYYKGIVDATFVMPEDVEKTITSEFSNKKAQLLQERIAFFEKGKSEAEDMITKLKQELSESLPQSLEIAENK